MRSPFTTTITARMWPPPAKVAARAVALLEDPTRPELQSPEPWRAALYTLGYEAADGTIWWDEVMDAINDINENG